jgi:hypothetical protein
MLVPLLQNNLLSSGNVQPIVTSPPLQLRAPTTILDIITGGMRAANILSAGETATPADSQDALSTLNDLLDSLSTDKDFIPTTTENVFNWIPNQYKYTIGNPIGGTFTGTLSIGSQLINNVILPSNLVVGGTLTDVQGAIPAGTTITAISVGSPFSVLTMSNVSLSNVPQAETIQYTTPGDIPIQRPLRISSAYTRIPSSTSALDYWFDTTLSMDRYNELGFKGVPGPWPIASAYQTTFPLSTLWIYPMPTSAYEVHLFTDLIFDQATSITQAINLPQGYTRALKKLLGLELCPEYGKTPSRELRRQAAEARAFIKALNASPVVTLRYDQEIVRSQTTDAEWIVHGGFQ